MPTSLAESGHVNALLYPENAFSAKRDETLDLMANSCCCNLGTIVSGSGGVTIAGQSGTVISSLNGVQTVIGASSTVVLSNGLPITVHPGDRSSASPTPVSTAQITSFGSGFSSGSAVAPTSTYTGGVGPAAMPELYMMGAALIAGGGALM